MRRAWQRERVVAIGRDGRWLSACVTLMLLGTVSSHAGASAPQSEVERRRDAAVERVRRGRAVVVRHDTSRTDHFDKADEERRCGKGEVRRLRGDTARGGAYEGPKCAGAVEATKHFGRMYYHIPEYHDEQHFQISTNEFGPIVYLYASPFLGMFQQVSDIAEQGQFGAFAAVIEVDAPTGTPLRGEYTSLNLRPGVNCLWLANPANAAGNPTGWVAYVTVASGLGTCDRPVEGSVLPSLTVTRFADSPRFRHADFPPVARFSEAQYPGGSTYGQPLIGVKCLDGWCEIGPMGAVPTPAPTGYGRLGAIKGWHDEQVLAHEDGAGVLRPTARATLIPDRFLEQHRLETFQITDPRPVDSERGWVSVATIVMSANPPAGSKYDRWGLTRGENYVFLRRITPGTGKNDWQMSVVNNVLPSRMIWTNVTREKHTDVLVPGTARWRFASYDPTGVWVRCGAACCSGDGGT